MKTEIVPIIPTVTNYDPTNGMHEMKMLEISNGLDHLYRRSRVNALPKAVIHIRTELMAIVNIFHKKGQEVYDKIYNQLHWGRKQKSAEDLGDIEASESLTNPNSTDEYMLRSIIEYLKETTAEVLDMPDEHWENKTALEVQEELHEHVETLSVDDTTKHIMKEYFRTKLTGGKYETMHPAKKVWVTEILDVVVFPKLKLIGANRKPEDRPPGFRSPSTRPPEPLPPSSQYTEPLPLSTRPPNWHPPKYQS